MTLNIVHCLAPAPAGGLETVVRLLATGQRARGHRVTVIAVVEEANHPFPTLLASDGIDVEVIHLPSRAYRRERAQVMAILRRIQPDIVHAHGFRPDLIDLPAARALGLPTVSTLHGFIRGNWKIKLYERLQLRIIRHNSAVIAVSQGVADNARAHHIPAHLIHRIPNAYAPSPMRSRDDARRALALSDEVMHLAWIGRLWWEKGADVALAAMARLTDVPISLSILGDGHLRDTLEAEARARNLRVRFHGRVDDAAQFLAAFDGCLLSSRLEGTPMVLLEAMAARVPIIATRVGGVPDMLTDDEASLVPAESPAALASAIQALYADPQAGAERAERAHARWARDFTVSPWLDRHDALYAAIQRSPTP